MTPATYPTTDGGSEYALACDKGRRWRLLIVPALFDEANRLRRFTVELMRRFDKAGIDSFLPDLPGTNESTAALSDQSLTDWTAAMIAAAEHFRATHALGVRGGSVLVPHELPSWLYAPSNGAACLRQLTRARALGARESGRNETADQLFAQGNASGVELCGYSLGPAFFRDFPSAVPPVHPRVVTIEQDEIGGAGLWLRAEPDEDKAQADALAALVAMGVKA